MGEPLDGLARSKDPKNGVLFTKILFHNNFILSFGVMKLVDKNIENIFQ